MGLPQVSGFLMDAEIVAYGSRHDHYLRHELCSITTRVRKELLPVTMVFILRMKQLRGCMFTKM